VEKSQGIQQSKDDIGKVGNAYWYAFLRRHTERIRTKKGRKFKLDRSNWTKYRNFLTMYQDVEEELIEAGLAVKLDPPHLDGWEGKQSRRNKFNGNESVNTATPS
jgi:hypothetical protein